MAGALSRRASFIVFGILFCYLLSTTAQGLFIPREGDDGGYHVWHQDPPTSRLSAEEIERILREADEVARADELRMQDSNEHREDSEEENEEIRKDRERSGAKNRLYYYIRVMDQRIRGLTRGRGGRNYSDELKAGEKDTINAALDAASEWLYVYGETAEKNEFREKLKEVEDVWNPIVRKCTEADRHSSVDFWNSDDEL